MNTLVSTIQQHWLMICDIHNITKELHILSEEYDLELKSFLQPIKELKDAYEHIIRANTRLYTNTEQSEADIAYIKVNMEKAIGHEYRAFFDTADFLCITLRLKIAEKLKAFDYNDIVHVWPSYEHARARIVMMAEEIAALRMQKDVGSTGQMHALITQYREIVGELLTYYKHVELRAYPELTALLK